MDEYIAFDSHKRYTLAERESVAGGRVRQNRIEHRQGAIRTYLADCRPGGAVAVEATGNWYWIVDEIEEAGQRALLVHPGKAKLMMGMINKTDKLDVHGLNRLQRNQTLPTVWIPPGELRDLRELTRTRMVLSQQRTRLKNRLGATLCKYGLVVEGFTDSFGAGARRLWPGLLAQLPRHTRFCAEVLLEELDRVCHQIARFELCLGEVVEMTESMRLLLTLPGVGPILAPVIALEVGDASRFCDAEHLASYCGTTPRVHSSGDKTRYGKLRADVNHYLKWAFVEAANSTAMHHHSHPDRHVSQLYRRLKARRGHPKAIGAVARHLAEATWHVLTRHEAYRDPGLGQTRKA
ncbi:MAG: IS110 family transposase [Planctomycetota bacterium]